MKKFTIILSVLLMCMIPAFSENLRIKVEGPEGSYNSLSIINNSDYENFSCTAYLLEEKDGSFVVKKELGKYYLKEKTDSDTCSMKLKKGQYIGVTFADGIADLDYKVSYKDLPFYDIVEIYLYNSDQSSPEFEVGEEF